MSISCFDGGLWKRVKKQWKHHVNSFRCISFSSSYGLHVSWSILRPFGPFRPRVCVVYFGSKKAKNYNVWNQFQTISQFFVCVCVFACVYSRLGGNNETAWCIYIFVFSILTKLTIQRSRTFSLCFFLEFLVCSDFWSVHMWKCHQLARHTDHYDLLYSSAAFVLSEKPIRLVFLSQVLCFLLLEI